MTTMSPLQQFKNAATPGSRFTTVDHWKEDLIGTIREVEGGKTVLSGRVLHADGSVLHPSYRLEMPKARDITMPRPGVFRIDLGGDRFATFQAAA